MTIPEFQSYFQRVFEELIPEPGRRKIKEYWKQNNIKYSVTVSDKRMDELEKESGRKFPSGVLYLDGLERAFVFRSCLLEAPELVLRTVIQHELIHAYFETNRIPPSVLPVSQRADLSNPVGYIKQAFDRSKESFRNRMYRIEEEIVSGINRDWGGDEAIANDWIKSYCP